MVFSLSKTATRTGFFGMDGTNLVVGCEAIGGIQFRSAMDYANTNILGSGSQVGLIDNTGKFTSGSGGISCSGTLALGTQNTSETMNAATVSGQVPLIVASFTSGTLTATQTNMINITSGAAALNYQLIVSIACSVQGASNPSLVISWTDPLLTATNVSLLFNNAAAPANYAFTYPITCSPSTNINAGVTAGGTTGTYRISLRLICLG
jgi:hypothetical protein